MQNGLNLLFLFQVLCNFPGRKIIILSLQFIAISLIVPCHLTFYFFYVLMCIHVLRMAMYPCVLNRGVISYLYWYP